MHDLLWVLATPRTALRRLLVTQPIGLALFVLVLGQLSTSFARFLAVSGSRAPLAVLDAVFNGGLTLTCIFIGTAFFHLFATMLGGRGNPGQLFWGLMVSSAPWLLATPAAISLLYLQVQVPELYHLTLFVAVIVLAAWSVGLKAYVISTLYNLSGSGGLFVFFVGLGSALLLAGAATFCSGMASMIWIMALGGTN